VENKVAVCPYVYLDLLNYAIDFDAVFSIAKVVQEEGLYVGT
jgi:hypothetical protein